MLFPKTNNYFHISRLKQSYKWYGRSADVYFKIKNVSAQGSNIEYHIQDQRDSVQRLENSAKKLCI